MSIFRVELAALALNGFASHLDANSCTNQLTGWPSGKVCFKKINMLFKRLSQRQIEFPATTTIGLLEVMGTTQVYSHSVRRASKVIHNSQAQFFLIVLIVFIFSFDQHNLVVFLYVVSEISNICLYYLAHCISWRF